MAGNEARGVLVVYTGGTIGSRPRDPDPDSPQVVVLWAELEKGTPELLQLKGRGLRVDCEEIKPLDSCNVGPQEWQQIAGPKIATILGEGDQVLARVQVGGEKDGRRYVLVDGVDKLARVEKATVDDWPWTSADVLEIPAPDAGVQASKP